MRNRASVNIAKCIVAAAGFLAALAHAANIPVFNTGVSASGTLLPLGAVDPNWSIVSGPGVTAPQAAYVLTSQRNPVGTYYPTSDSQWIWAAASGVAGVGSPYTFELKFNLAGFDPATVTISGAWGVDNLGTIELNGAPAIGTGLSLTNPSNFTAPNPFSITGGFIAGINTLDIVATDQGFVGGVDVTALIATGAPISPVPEPGACAMMIAGLGMLIIMKRARRIS